MGPGGFMGVLRKKRSWGHEEGARRVKSREKGSFTIKGGTGGESIKKGGGNYV